jgi:hypothetical protein
MSAGASTVMTLPQLVIVPPFLDFKERYHSTLKELLVLLLCSNSASSLITHEVRLSVCNLRNFFFHRCYYSFYLFIFVYLFYLFVALMVCRALCMPAVEAVSIINTSEQEELHLFSISTDSVHFHSSFFKQSVRPPRASLCEWACNAGNVGCGVPLGRPLLTRFERSRATGDTSAWQHHRFHRLLAEDRGSRGEPTRRADLRWPSGLSGATTMIIYIIISI